MLGEHWFAYRIHPELPLTPEAEEAAKEDFDLAEAEVRGLVVISQTCDIVRGCADRPFVEVCPLVVVDERMLRDIQRGRRPSYGYIPGVADELLVADLDRVMTIEKAVLADWERVPGCDTDEDVRRLAFCLARKRMRFAFPDDFAALAAPLQRRLQEKHDKQSDEGRGLRGLREIRVRAAPSWDAPEVEVLFWFIRDGDQPEFEGKSWDELLGLWLKLIPETGRFTPVDGVVVTLDDLTARDYVESDPLDLDHLSNREE